MLYLGKTRFHALACSAACLACLPSLVAQERPSAKTTILRPVANRQAGAIDQPYVVLQDIPELAVPRPLTLQVDPTQELDTRIEENEKAARAELTPLLTRDLSIQVRTVSTSAADLGGLLPEPEARVGTGPRALPDGAARGAPFKCVHWKPSAICHFPLYFEDAMLERHGHTRFVHLQPVVSGAKFFGTLPLIPYLTSLQPACEPTYALGHFRPGSCAPVLKSSIPWDKRAAAVETLSLAGFFWAIPL